LAEAENQCAAGTGFPRKPATGLYFNLLAAPTKDVRRRVRVDKTLRGQYGVPLELAAATGLHVWSQD
jgi:hypothetical protein